MKKIFVLIAAFVAISFASCGNKTEAGAGADTDTVVVDSAVVDTLASDTAVVADSVAADAVEVDSTAVAE